MNRLATIFSIITTAGVLLAAVSGLVWIIAALRHRETAAKALCIAGIIVAVVGFALFLRSYDSSLHRARPQEPETPATQTVTPVQPQEAAQEPEQAANEANPLLALEVQTRPVMNGFKTERIGTWAYIETTKEFMSSVTDQQLYDYLSELSAKSYNWFNVFFEDGTGLWCMSSLGGYYIEYGAVDEDEGGAVIHDSDVAIRYLRYENGAYVEDTE